jgi:hypothetical protein
MVAGKLLRLRRVRVGSCNVGIPTDSLGPGCNTFSQRNKPNAFERQHEIGEDVSSDWRRQRAGCVAGLAIRNQRTASSHYATEDVVLRIWIGDHLSRRNGQDWRLTSELVGFVGRMSNNDLMPGAGQCLGESLEQCGISAGEKDHGVSLGRGKEPVKGWERLRSDLDDFVA